MVDEQQCRICGGELKIVLDLGEIYPSTFLKDGEKLSEDSKAPLILAECKQCGLVQLKHTVDLDLMYRQYWYNSSLNKSMVSSLRDVVNYVESFVSIEPHDAVVDIGCNDGTMLSMYKQGVGIGFDPALNVKNNCTLFINDYFSAKDYPKSAPKAKVVTAIACFYDLPDPNKFVEDVKEILNDKGIFVVQFTDLLSMFKATAFDNICNEHLEYYKLSDVDKLLTKHGLSVVDVSYNNVNGGSVRITACHSGAYLPKPSVITYTAREREFFKHNNLASFRDRIDDTILNTQLFLIKNSDKTTFLLGASTKGNTLLQICGITDKQIPYAADVNKEKFGLRTVGSDIKIVSEEEALAMNPDYLFVAIWHFKENLLANKKIREFIENGGELVFPLPEFHIIGKDNLQ
jgi:trans-aconitate methyltransferase/ribosomal protein L32